MQSSMFFGCRTAHSSHRNVPALIFFLLACGAAQAATDPRSSSDRALLATPSKASSDCTPPRTIADASKPFCFVPPTISAEAQQFLATSAAGAAPFGTSDFGTTPEEQAISIAKLRTFFPSALANLSVAAEAQYIGSKRNASIAGVPVVIAVPNGVQESQHQGPALLAW
jgi:hypothetical protein